MSAPHSSPSKPRPRLSLFFAVALGFTWILQAPALLARFGALGGNQMAWLPLVGLGAFGPVIAACVAAHGESGRAGIRTLFATLRTPFRPHWAVIALFLFPAIHVVGAIGYRLVSHSDAVALWYPPENRDQVVALFLFPLVEEPGWRGFAQPRLAARFGPLHGGFVVGIFWALWHVVMFVLQGMTPVMFAVAVLNIVAGAVVFAWLWVRTGGSLLAALLAHAGAHLNNPTHAMPAAAAPFYAYTASIVVVALVMAWVEHQKRPL